MYEEEQKALEKNMKNDLRQRVKEIKQLKTTEDIKNWCLAVTKKHNGVGEYIEILLSRDAPQESIFMIDGEIWYNKKVNMWVWAETQAQGKEEKALRKLFQKIEEEKIFFEDL